MKLTSIMIVAPLMLSVSAHAASDKSTVRDFKHKQSELNRLALQGADFKELCAASRAAERSFESVTGTGSLALWGKLSRNFEKLSAECEEIGKIDAFSNEKLEEDPVSFRARATVHEINHEANAIFQALAKSAR